MTKSLDTPQLEPLHRQRTHKTSDATPVESLCPQKELDLSFFATVRCISECGSKRVPLFLCCRSHNRCCLSETDSSLANIFLLVDLGESAFWSGERDRTLLACLSDPPISTGAAGTLPLSMAVSSDLADAKSRLESTRQKTGFSSALGQSSDGTTSSQSE